MPTMEELLGMINGLENQLADLNRDYNNLLLQTDTARAIADDAYELAREAANANDAHIAGVVDRHLQGVIGQALVRVRDAREGLAVDRATIPAMVRREVREWLDQIVEEEENPEPEAPPMEQNMNDLYINPRAFRIRARPDARAWWDLPQEGEPER